MHGARSGAGGRSAARARDGFCPSETGSAPGTAVAAAGRFGFAPDDAGFLAAGIFAALLPDDAGGFALATARVFAAFAAVLGRRCERGCRGGVLLPRMILPGGESGPDTGSAVAG